MSTADLPGFWRTVAQVFVARLARAASLQVGGGTWLWPGSGIMGSGDRGPPGSWQMNRNAPHNGMELMAFSAVYACVNIIASDLAKMPVQVFKVDQDTGERELQRGDYYSELFRIPNHYQTTADFLHAFVQSYLLQGNTYCYVGERNGRDEILSMHVLNPYRVKPLIFTDTGDIFYECGAEPLAGLTEARNIIPDRDIIHHRLPLMPGYPLVGVTPIFAAAASSALGLQILRDSQQFFGNASRPSGVLSTDQHMSDDNKARTKQEWDQAYRGEEFGKTAVLTGGMKWQPLTITAQDAQLIEQLRYSVEDVARVFRVPVFLLGDMTKATYRNTEHMNRAYYSGTLSAHIESLQQRFQRAFEFPLDYELRLDLSSFLRTELDVRYTAYQTALAGGWISPNEVRAQEGMGPVDGGDEPRMQMQYVPLSQEQAPAPAPSAPPPPSDQPPPPAEQAVDPMRVRRLVRHRLRRAA